MTFRARLSLCFSSAVLALMAFGCSAPGVGDPCDPESVPEGGFESSEAYLETSSVQCRTRVCMVYHLAGDTRKVTGTDSCDETTDTDCVNGNSDCDDGDTVSSNCVTGRVYCTCRCDAPKGSSTTTCECPDGYSCEEVVATNAAGAGVRGSYCVKKKTVDTEE
ncbi:MAG: hypothetical protein R3A78_01305 [Polyangiales bacterium]